MVHASIATTNLYLPQVVGPPVLSDHRPGQRPRECRRVQLVTDDVTNSGASASRSVVIARTSTGIGTSMTSRTQIARSSDHRSPVHASANSTSADRASRSCALAYTCSRSASLNGNISVRGDEDRGTRAQYRVGRDHPLPNRPGEELPVWLEERADSVSAKTYVAGPALPRWVPPALGALPVAAVTDREVTRTLVGLSRQGFADASVTRSRASFSSLCDSYDRSSRGHWWPHVLREDRLPVQSQSLVFALAWSASSGQSRTSISRRSAATWSRRALLPTSVRPIHVVRRPE